ncbi:threonine transporter [Corynebacterium sp. HMSC05H05]|uniref:LysE family translocator n=1 Tax=Corynebacterium sp. HMSC05H05 TaxID=1581119 RepID=UPI0008A4550E|nr:LysE family translocator [Corynebacterium sp. HMSC05H05]OFT59423.1 threonine transporter [Corynebacterium sp. HMSC05H05]
MIALLGVWLAAIASPGPDLVQIIRVGSKDRRSGVMCALGIMLGNTIWIVASLAGLSALIQAFPQVLSVLQIVGGAYLLWMGIGAIRASDPEIPATKRVPRPLLTGLLTNLSNPKAILFFGAIFAQFAHLGWIAAPVMVITGTIWFTGFALAVQAMSQLIVKYSKLIDVITGSIFIALALWMLWEGLHFGS